MTATPRRLAVAFLCVLSACEQIPEPALVATTIAITPSTAVSLAAIGATRQLAAVVTDQHGGTLADADVAWTTSSAPVVTVSPTGLATAVGNGSAQITATSGSANTTVTVTVAQAPAQVVKVSGDLQSAGVNQALAQPIVVQVNDATGHAIAGVSVGFAAAAGSGNVGTASALTNASGQAQSTWTLGPTAGTKTASATVAGSGIGGNPVGFSATAVGPPGGPPVLTLVASGLSSALYVTAPPGDTVRAFVVQQSGAIRVLRHDSLLSTPFLNLSGSISYGGERGLLSMAFHPNYASNRQFYVDYTAPNGALTVARYLVSSTNPNVADPTSGQVLLSIPHATNSNHNGGLVTFGPDGYLYIGTGDGGGGGDPDGNGQDSTVLLGKILRIDVDGAFPYAIPPTNPFVGRSGADEVWAYGLRNPWRFSFDRMTHDFYIADVGQDDWEEVDVAPAGDLGGHNYGWNRMEGLHCYEPMTGCVMTGLVMPVYEYAHGPGSSLGCSVSGGYVYRGTRVPALTGRYFFAEYCAGWIRSFRMQGGIATDVVQHTEFGTVTNITSFGEDGRGELYVTRESGQVYRITPQ